MKTLKNIAPTYQTLDYFTKRLEISQTFHQSLIKMFKDNGDMFSLYDFQLREISLPPGFEHAILQKILYLQEQKAAQNQQEVEVKESEIVQKNSEADADKSFVLSEAAYSGDIAIEKEKSEGEARVIGAYAEAYHNFGAQLGWICSTVAGVSCNAGNVAQFGFDALHYFIYSRLGKAREKKIHQYIGFDKDNTVMNYKYM